MNNNNPLNNFNTNSYSQGFKDVEVLRGECPTFSQAMSQPLKIVDYIGCHKILLIIIIGLIAFIFYSGVKAKAASEGAGKGGKPGGALGKK